MPTVGGKKYAYTPKGIKRAKVAARKAGKQIRTAHPKRPKKRGY
tara:strand:- start:86 stop:217 length:132 start_codon:yes stop_codon:yes gene_type:complete